VTKFMKFMKMRPLFFALTLGITLPACDLILGPTKVSQGQLYQSGEEKYDPYFAEVHQAQVAAAAWPDDAKAARKPIVTALNLAPSASMSTILSATRRRRAMEELGAPSTRPRRRRRSLRGV